MHEEQHFTKIYNWWVAEIETYLDLDPLSGRAPLQSASYLYAILEVQSVRTSVKWLPSHSATGHGNVIS